MGTIESVKASELVATVLEDAGVDATTDLYVRTIGRGRCFVTPDSYSIVGRRIQCLVQALVPTSGDYETYGAMVWQVLDTDDRTTPIGMDWAPLVSLPGSDTSYAAATITVVTATTPASVLGIDG